MGLVVVRAVVGFLVVMRVVVGRLVVKRGVVGLLVVNGFWKGRFVVFSGGGRLAERHSTRVL